MKITVQVVLRVCGTFLLPFGGPNSLRLYFKKKKKTEIKQRSHHQYKRPYIVPVRTHTFSFDCPLVVKWQKCVSNGYFQFDADFRSAIVPNVVWQSLDFVPNANAYRVSTMSGNVRNAKVGIRNRQHMDDTHEKKMKKNRDTPHSWGPFNWRFYISLRECCYFQITTIYANLRDWNVCWT